MTSIGRYAEAPSIEHSVGDGLISPETYLTVANIMNREVVSVRPCDTVRATIQALHRNNVSSVAVVEGPTVVGMVTERDILTSVARDGGTFVTGKAADIMSSPVDAVSPDLPVLEAGLMMEAKGLKRLPVTANECPVGIVTQTDVTRALISLDPLSEISEVMSPRVVTCDAQSTVAEAVEIMSDRGITCLLVVHGGKPLGMLTEKDVLKRVVVLGKAPKRTQVADVMSFPMLSVPPTYSVFSAGKKMDEMHIHRLVVMASQDVCGIVTKTDVMKAIRKKVHHDQSERLRQLDESDNPACVLDSTGTIVHVNPAFLELFETDRTEEFLGRSFLPKRFWAHPEERKAVANVLGPENLMVRRLALRSANGREIRVVVFSTLTRSFDGKVNGRQDVFCDLTAHTMDGWAPSVPLASVKS